MINAARGTCTQDDAFLATIEDDLIAAEPHDVLNNEAARALASEARALVAALLVARRPSKLAVRRATTRRERWSTPSRKSSEPKRAIVQRLLVADSRAREMIGAKVADDLSDNEIDAVIEEFVRSGLLPSADK